MGNSLRAITFTKEQLCQPDNLYLEPEKPWQEIQEEIKAKVITENITTGLSTGK